MKKVDVNDLEQKLTRVLLRGVTAQVTISIRKILVNTSNFTLLCIFISIFGICKQYKAPSLWLNIIHSLALDAALAMVIFREKYLTIINLLTVFLIGTAFNEEDLSGTAQYIVATKIAEISSTNNTVDILVSVVLYIIIQQIKGFPRLKGTLSIAILTIIQNWFIQVIPKDSQIPCILMLLYAFSPWLDKSTRTIDIYNILLNTITYTLNVKGVSYSIQTAMAAVVWLWHLDPVSKTVSQMVMVRLLQLVFIQSLQNMFRSDPFLVSMSMILFLQFLLDLLVKH